VAISITWATKVIYVPQADLTFISGVLYELDVNVFRLALKDLEDDEEGMAFVDTHRHNTEVTLGGVTFARTVEIINGYTVEFEDGQYTVRCVGANHNIADVKVANQVSLIIGNSAGLIVTDASGLTPGESQKLTEFHQAYGLDASNPVTHRLTPARIEFAGITLVLTTDVDGNVTVTRS